MTLEQPGLEPEFSRHYSFTFDSFQLEAIAEIRADRSVMVAAPTSAGKTVVAEYALWRTVSAGKRAVYTTPIKALSNQKWRDLDGFFPGNVGLLTGDRSENRDASVLVMTTEVLRNMLLEDPETLDKVGCVIFDEVHYLADRDRGTIWEESIITCLPHIQLVCLSATIANAVEVAAWISQTHRPITLVRHDQRPVPLEHFAFTGGALRLIRDAEGKRAGTVPASPARRGRQRSFASPEDVIQSLRRADILPAIWFAFTRRGVELDAERCALANPEVSGVQREAIEQAIAQTLSGIPAEDRGLAQIGLMLSLLRRGVGFHHAGLIPPCKELVENLFVRGLLSVVCATDTLSVGINMPARTVVIGNMTRPVAGLLTANDFSQLTGRAGRRGIDRQGAVVILPTPFHDFERSYATVTGQLEPIRSAFTLRYSTLLSMFRGDKPEERLAKLVRASLRQFQLYGEARGPEKRLAVLEAELATQHPLPEVEGREVELDEYLQIQRRLTIAERGSRSGDRPTKRRKGRVARHRGADRAEIDSLRSLLRMHPMHEIASRGTFQQAAAGRIRLLRERAGLRETVERTRREQDLDAESTARAVGSVLRRLGYVDRHRLLPKAAGLRELVAPSGIVLSEMYHEGMVGNLQPEELAEALSWFASDVDRRRYNSFQLPHVLMTLRTRADLVFRRVSGLEEAHGIRLAQGPSTWFWGVALAWCRGKSIAAISPHIEIAEGDIVSILNKTVDLMDQLRGLLMEYGDSTTLATLREARLLLCRGMVAAIRSGGLTAMGEESTPALAAALEGT